MSIGENVGRAPTGVFVGNNGSTAPTTMYTEPTQIGTGCPKLVSINLYNKAVKLLQIGTDYIKRMLKKNINYLKIYTIKKLQKKLYLYIWIIIY